MNFWRHPAVFRRESIPAGHAPVAGWMAPCGMQLRTVPGVRRLKPRHTPAILIRSTIPWAINRARVISRSRRLSSSERPQHPPSRPSGDYSGTVQELLKHTTTDLLAHEGFKHPVMYNPGLTVFDQPSLSFTVQ